jgi:hypothetical protein
VATDLVEEVDLEVAEASVDLVVEAVVAVVLEADGSCSLNPIKWVSIFHLISNRINLNYC